MRRPRRRAGRRRRGRSVPPRARRRADRAAPARPWTELCGERWVERPSRPKPREVAVGAALLDLVEVARREEHDPERLPDRHGVLAELPRHGRRVLDLELRLPAVLGDGERVRPEDECRPLGRRALHPVQRRRLRRRGESRAAARPTTSCSPRRAARRRARARGRREGGARPHRRTGPAARRVFSPIASGPAWISTSTRARSSSARVGIPVSDGRLATTPEEARAAAEELGGPGRRQGAGAHRRPRQGGRDQARRRPRPRPRSARGRSSVSTSAATSCAGSGSSRRRRSRRSTTSRSRSTAARRSRCFMFTTQGGVDIEQVAEESPDALVRLHVDPLEGFHPWQARRLVYGAGVDRSRPSRSRSPRSSGSSTRRSCASTRCSARSTR